MVVVSVSDPLSPVILVNDIIFDFNVALPAVPLRVERLKLGKRRWRGTAEDGVDFGFELQRPLKPGAVFHQTETVLYVIEQLPEPVLEIALDFPPCAAAGIGWAVGNLHLELMSEPERLLAIDDPAVRQLLERIQVPFTPTTAVFRPGRFAREAKPAHELGPSHKH